MDLVFQRFKSEGTRRNDFEEFCRQNDFWLEGYSLFVAFKKHFQNAAWIQWPEAVKQRHPATLQDLAKRYEGDIERVKFEQFIFRKQWEELRAYCQQSGVKIIGDIPIYVNDDSADVWRHPEFFKLTADLKPEFVAGIPPDYFSATGQRWGNPVYRWETLRQTGYSWWQERFKHNFQFFDMIRIDHFRGMVSFWQIPAHEQTAMNGQWVDVPWDDFLTVMKKHFGSLPIIAEDLGIITPEVTGAMKKFGFPGMKILLFAFDGETETHPYIPKNYSEDCVVYTGTHDNNTTRGWFDHEASHDAKERFFQYIGKRVGVEDAVWEMIRLAMTSVADIAIIPLQDILGLGQDARMNTPATTHGNWRWRLSGKMLTPVIADKLVRLTRDSQR
jgi:4-alpha-glucanotransferase